MLLILAACSTECLSGFHVGSDGMCYRDAVEADLDALSVVVAACSPGATDGALDILAGCADDVCVGMSLTEVEAAWGAAAACDEDDCQWSSGLEVQLDGAEVVELVVRAPWTGGTTDGLGPGATMGCFLEAYGQPDHIDAWRDDGGSLELWAASWFTHGVLVFDEDALLGDGDQRVDTLFIEGAGD